MRVSTTLEQFTNNERFEVRHAKDDEEHTVITINVPDKNDLQKNNDFMTKLKRRLRYRSFERMNKDDLSSSGKTETSEADHHKMSYEEIAVYVDTKARIIFPLLFVIFNIIYWLMVADMETYEFFMGGDDESQLSKNLRF